jgi:predicted O-methyltransferase YrrM
MWAMLAAMIGARRFLEVGCGLGYTAAVMAHVAGTQALVDTIERDSLHAEIAERELARRGLGDRVRVLRGDATPILQYLQEPYDVVFLDTDWEHYPEWLPDLTRLTRRGGLLVSGNLFSLLADWGRELPQKEAIREYLTILVRDLRFRTWIIAELWHALSYRIA